MKKNPLDMMNLMGQSTLQKKEERFPYLKVIGLSVRIIQMVVFGR